jgi:hypothetical protein
MRLTKLTLKSFRGFSDKFELPLGRNNVLIYGENGSSKSSIARALELVFDPRPGCDLISHQHLFGTTTPEITAEFAGSVTRTRPSDGKKFAGDKKEKLTWTAGTAKPLPSWLLSSSARSAFLDHRKLLLLSDRQRDLPESFFLTTVRHLFAHLPVGLTGKTVAVLWDEIEAGIKSYRAARQARDQKGATGTTNPVAHYRTVTDSINALNSALDEYLTPTGRKPTALVAEAERLLSRFEDLHLGMTLDFEHLTFNRHTGETSGGRLRPHVVFCSKDLGSTANGEWNTSHHMILNEARLTALALALFFAAVRLQDQIAYTPGAGDPDEPARLLVLDDVLVGLDYDHRIPVLEILRKDFLKKKRFQLVLLTHNREWFDLCRLKVGTRGWSTIELYSRRGKGRSGSDYPVLKEASSDLVLRAKDFLDNEHEPRAAANYARTAIEWALRELCAKKQIPVPFNLDAHRYDTDDFLKALTGEGHRKKKRTIIKKPLRTDLEALRKTVLNAFSHWNPTTSGTTEIKRAIKVAEQLVELAKSG